LDLHAPVIAADSDNLLDAGRIGGGSADHRRHGERHGVDMFGERSAR
jgi:hypothetical protein